MERKSHQTRAGGSKKSAVKGKSGLGIVRMRYGVPVVEEEEQREEIERVRPIWWCPECGSSQTYYRFKSNTQRCRACGHEWERVDLRKVEK